MDIQELRREAQTMQPQLTADRRRLHQNPEAGAVLPETVAYVKGRLTEMGYHPQELGGGLTATVTGTDTGRCILLRADMDALRGQEQSGLSFRSENGCMHACGHDMHTAMLLGAAQLLMQHRQELSGTVKLVFQPDEEGFTGAKSMLAAGVLQAPAPSEALALHVHSGTPSGTVLCGSGTFMAGCTLFRITVRGKGCHGAMPETGVDPIGIAAQIWLALQEITGRELPAKTPAVVTVGRFQAGQAPNIIPDEAVLEGTVRTFDRAVTARIMERIRQLSEGIASAFRGSAQMEELASAPPLQNDPALLLAEAFNTFYNTKVDGTYKRLNTEINTLYRLYMKGLMEMQPDRTFFPDANLTLRVAYGTVEGYSPVDAVYYEPFSTIDGIMEKDNPDIYDYNIPQRLRDLYRTKEYGRWNVDGSVPVCFLATNHTTGGNSGSPVLNGRGQLVGINFDRTWESTMSDYEFDVVKCRNIIVDIRYVLFVIDRIGNAGYLLDEMRFAK